MGEESTLDMARRHVREGERRVADQERRVEELERDGHLEAGGRARDLLQAMRETLALSREHLDIEERAGDR